MSTPFKKPIKQQPKESDKPFPGGRDRTSYQYGIEWVHPFNNDPADRSPTDMSNRHKPMDLDQFYPRPKK